MIEKLKRKYRELRCRPTINSKHDMVVFNSPQPTVREREQDKKHAAHCGKCGKDLGLR